MNGIGKLSLKNDVEISSIKDKKNILSPKILNLLETTNSTIDGLYDNEKMGHIGLTFKKFIRLLRAKLSKGLTDKDVFEIFDFIGKVFDLFNIKKVYNLDSVNTIDKYLLYSLEEKFINNIIPYNGEYSSSNLNVLGGTCYSWSIFFKDLIGEFGNLIDDLRIVSYTGNYDHSFLFFTFQGNNYIIDPFSKGNSIITKVNIGDNVYVGENSGNIIFGKLKSIFPFILDLDGIDLDTNSFYNNKDFAKTLKNPEFIVSQIRTFKMKKKLDFIIKKSLDGSILNINFNNISKHVYKQILIADIKPIIEKIDFSSYDILSVIFQEEILKNDIKTDLEYLALFFDKELFLKSLNS